MRPADLAILALAALATLGAGTLGSCASKDRGSATGAAGSSSTGAAGTSATGAAGTSATGAAGTSLSGAAGTSGPGAAGASATGAAGTTSNVDNGQLFRDAAVVVPVQAPPPATDAGGKPDATMPNPTGTLHINSIGLEAVFTQKGADVTMVLTAKNCPQGSHVIQIRAGFSCDNPSTQGGVWDGKRGDGIPAFTCGANKQGALTYTRTGGDPATNWTVGDHSTKTDVTLHPAMVEGNCGTFF
jgi:hypothetical protein